MNKRVLIEIVVVAALVILGINLPMVAPMLTATEAHGAEALAESAAMMLSIIAIMSWVSTVLTHGRPVPSYVAIVFIAIAWQSAMAPLHNPAVLGAIVMVSVIPILHDGGLAVKIGSFVRLMPKILILAVLGVWSQAYLTFLLLGWIGRLAGIDLTPESRAFLGMILASTDPAAVIPTLRALLFPNEAPRDVVISESAVNDVVGTVGFLTFIEMFKLNPGYFGASGEAYFRFISVATLSKVGLQMLIGALVGVGGSILLHLFHVTERELKIPKGANVVFIVGVPLASYWVATRLGGNGYMAAFISGLVFNVTEHVEHHVEDFTEVMVDGVFKMAIFFCLGLLVDLRELWRLLGFGTLAGLGFLAVRFVVVFSHLGALNMVRAQRTSVNEMAFIALNRMTGAIPGVLLVVAQSMGIPGFTEASTVGVVIILLSLIVLPAIMPWAAQRLGVACDPAQGMHPVPKGVEPVQL